MKALIQSALCAASLILLGCPGEEGARPSAPKTPPPSTTNPLPLPEGDVAALWMQACTQCHGALGDGNGEIVKSLREWPRDFTDPKWQASIDDTKMKAVIIGGGPATGLSEEMPSFPQLQGKTEDLEALVKHIRGFAKAKAESAKTLEPVKKD